MGTDLEQQFHRSLVRYQQEKKTRDQLEVTDQKISLWRHRTRDFAGFQLGCHGQNLVLTKPPGSYRQETEQSNKQPLEY